MRLAYLTPPVQSDVPGLYFSDYGVNQDFSESDNSIEAAMPRKQVHSGNKTKFPLQIVRDPIQRMSLLASCQLPRGLLEAR